jgi:hypothetical protein
MMLFMLDVGFDITLVSDESVEVHAHVVNLNYGKKQMLIFNIS